MWLIVDKMSMPGAWPDEEEVALSIETESTAYDEDENWLRRIDVRGIFVSDLPIVLKF